MNKPDFEKSLVYSLEKIKNHKDDGPTVIGCGKMPTGEECFFVLCPGLNAEDSPDFVIREISEPEAERYRMQIKRHKMMLEADWRGKEAHDAP